MRTVIAIQARLGSSRMPRKILCDLHGRPMLNQILRRCRAVSNADGVAIACPEWDKTPIKMATGLDPITGPEDDVLTRLLNVADELEADKLVRVTADCPLIPPDMIRLGIEAMEKAHTPVVQNWRPRTFPDGFDFEVWDVPVLQALSEKLRGKDREYFALWAMNNNMTNRSIEGRENLSKWRLTVDYPEDLEVVRAIYAEMGDEVWGSDLILRWCAKNPHIMKLNKKHVKDFGESQK